MSTKLKSSSQLGSLLSNKLKVNQKNGSMIVTNQPKLKVTGDPTPLQLEVQRRFVAASQYAADQLSTPEGLADYKAKVTDKKRTPFLVALSDYLTAPSIHSIDVTRYRGNIGDPIDIRATDDFRVVNVRVTITGADGTLLEEGDAVQDKAITEKWIYRCTAANAAIPGTLLHAVAADRPGNTASLAKAL